jgi:hypothetical protein
VHDATEPIPDAIRARRDGGWFAAIDGWRGVGRLACGAAGALAIAWFILLSPGETGSKADWFFGAVVFVVAVVAVWQTVNVQRQADRRVAEAAERLRIELAAAEKRSARELELTQRLHEAHWNSARLRWRADSSPPRGDGRRATAGSSRPQPPGQPAAEAGRHGGVAGGRRKHQMLATLWNRGASILHSGDREEREQSMLPIFEQIGQVVNDFSSNLPTPTRSSRTSVLNQALEGVNEAVLMAIRVAQEVCDDVVAGRAPETNPIPQVSG